jgi:ADP-heptose:LPS heptosyltransferase
MAIAAGVKNLRHARPLWQERSDEAIVARRLVDKMTKGRPLIGFGPRGTSITKGYPKEYQREVVEELEKHGKVIYLDCIKPPKGVLSEDTWVLVGHPLPIVASLIKRMKLLVTIDTGLLHIAAAVSTPTLGIFGPTEAASACLQYAPTHAWIEAEREETDCFFACNYVPVMRSLNKNKGRQRFSSECKEKGCDRMMRLTPDRVIKRIREVLNVSV